jgi:hypothetical protein
MPKFRRKIIRNQKKRNNPKKFPLLFIFGGLAIIIIALLFAFQKKTEPFTPEVTGKPSLKTDKEMVDLGNVKLGQTVRVSFELKNVGDETLRISNVPYVEVKEGC